MPESRSDIVDIVTGEINVDNGHMRSLVKNQKQTESSLFLDGFLEGNLYYDDDSTDELAPSEPSRSPLALNPLSISIPIVYRFFSRDSLGSLNTLIPLYRHSLDCVTHSLISSALFDAGTEGHVQLGCVATSLLGYRAPAVSWEPFLCL
jgi:hypothetical protein